MHELKTAKTLCRVVGDERAAITKAQEISRRFSTDVTVFAIRKRDGRKQFIRKIKAN